MYKSVTSQQLLHLTCRNGITPKSQIFNYKLSNLTRYFSTSLLTPRKGRVHVVNHAAFISSEYRNPFPLASRFYSTSTLDGNGKEIGSINSNSTNNPNARFYLSFTCKVCSTSNSYLISKQAYYHGVVITTCQNETCKSNHLIADNLGWFQDPHGKNIEEIMAAKGETVKKFIGTGINEYTPEITGDEIKGD